jgi:hypothetical protein
VHNTPTEQIPTFSKRKPTAKHTHSHQPINDFNQLKSLEYYWFGQVTYIYDIKLKEKHE